MKGILKGISTLTALNQSKQRHIRHAAAVMHSSIKSNQTSTNYRSLLAPRAFAKDAEVSGVLGDAMMIGKATDLLLTILVGGIIWLLATAVGLK
jgi:hypothetical protein